jgi:hypothetical protein
MKIYTKVVFDMTQEDLPVVEEESFEYEGPVAKCWTGPEREARLETIEKIEQGAGPKGLQLFGGALQQGLDKLKAEVRRDELKDFSQGYRDWELANLGYRVNPNTGEWEAIPYEELSPDQQLSRDIERLRGERTFAALKGNLPVSKGLERNLQKGLESTKLAVMRGPGEFSTPGIQKMGQAELNAETLREQVRTGQITEGYANYLQQQQLTGGLQSQYYQNALQGYGLSTGLDLAYAQLASQEKMQDDANRVGLQQSRYGLAGDIIGGIGTGIGAYYGLKGGGGKDALPKKPGTADPFGNIQYDYPDLGTTAARYYESGSR